MQNRSRVALGATLLLLAVAPASAQVSASPAIPIRQLAPAEATSEKVEFRVSARTLSGGRVLVALRSKVLLFDSTLKTFTVVVDSSSLTPGRAALGIPMIPFTGDSTLIVDVGAQSFLVLDPNGKITRVMAAPRPSDALQLASPYANTGIDAKGRLIYRAAFRPPPPVFMPGAPMVMPSPPDTFPLVRADFDSRVIDTLGVLNAPTGIRMTMNRSADGKMSTAMVRQPLPTLDEWAVLSDGSLAIVRGHDYHIDWVYGDGTRASTPKMPFDWRRLTEDDKVHLIDSMRVLEARYQVMSDSMNAARGLPPRAPSPLANQTYVPPNEIPDYYPPIRQGAAKADRDGNLWILPATSLSARGGLLYDVVNRRGEVFERVQLPPSCALAGFAPGGVVYLGCGLTLQRTHVLR
jgi:hypothetical protein